MALAKKNLEDACDIYLDIVTHARRLSDITENDEKLLNQIQVIYKKYAAATVSQLKFSPFKEPYQQLKILLRDHIRSCSDPVHHMDFQQWETALGLNRAQLDLLYKTAMTFQMTRGCSHFCRRCNEWALPKVRSHFSFNAVCRILDRMTTQDNTDIALYGASDPLDWDDSHHTLCDIIDYADQNLIEYSILTKVPRRKEPLLKNLLKKGTNLSVSLTSKNKTRICKIEKEIKTVISKQHDLDELLIPAGRDEDFSSIKPSITDGYGTEITPDGAFIILPTFTSALHPYGHQKIKITSDTTFFPLKKTGRQALLVDYFKPLEGYDLNKNRVHLTYLLDVQVESILLDNGTDELTPPGMRSLKEYLSIFDEKARRQRQRMTPSVMKRLKKETLSQQQFKHLASRQKIIYLNKIKRHLLLCKKTPCFFSKLNAMSFFLSSVCAYQKKNPTRTDVIKILLKDEMSVVQQFGTKKGFAADIKDTLKDPASDSFDVFRFLVFNLLTDQNLSVTHAFIEKFSSHYDPITDIFVQSKKTVTDTA